jgi:hypothetical protein
MWNEPTPAQLARLPALYATESTPSREKLIYEHFFLGVSDWYAAEYGARERLFFGFAILNGDLDNAEWGYFSYDELRSVRVRGLEVDRDLHWRVRPAGEVEKIVAACRT